MKKHTIIAALMMTTLTAGCVTPMNDTNTPSEQAMKTTITGEVFYLPRIALPPGAELSVVLVDTSLSNPLANLFAGTNIALDGKNIPVPFSFVADKSTMIPGDTYEVRAVIREKAGDIIWRTKVGHVVDLSSGAYNAGKLELVMVDKFADSNQTALTGKTWIIEAMNSSAVLKNSDISISFNPQGQISGSGGCNYFSGDYEASAKVLNVASNIALTQKACTEPLMQQDQN